METRAHAPSFAAAARGRLGALASNCAAFVFPRLCLLCDEPRPPESDWLCGDCLDNLSQNHERRNPCSRCGINPRVRTCTCDAHWDHPFERIVAMFDYDDTVKVVMQQIKYQGRSRLAFELGLSCAPQVPLEFAEDADIIVPVPLHWFRKLSRGYNQAAALAAGLAHGLTRPLPVLDTAVRRRRYTRTQTRLGRDKRQRNLTDAFVVRESYRSKVAGKTVILVDDVVTTGATTGSCARALLEAGAREVRVFCLARD